MLMKNQDAWLEIFASCKDNIKACIKPHLNTIGKPQPSLGMGAGGDQMKPVDLAAEKAIVETIRQYDVSFTLISEESGVQEYGKTPKECYVTVDPVDGTTNFVRGLPFFASSIAVSSAPVLSAVYAGIVADLVHNTAYTAIKGKGAFCNTKRIFSSKVSSLDDAVIGLDLNTNNVADIAPRLTSLVQKTGHIRHFGANALELCYVAEGLTDAFVDIRGKLRTTDVAAGMLILKEAGGTVTTHKDETFDAKLDPKERIKFVASGNKNIHKSIINLVKPKC
jgi:myo-inositol-1(or 4)-monophosphatase